MVKFGRLNKFVSGWFRLVVVVLFFMCVLL